MKVYSQQLEQEKLEEMRAVVNTITGYMVLPLYLIFWIPDLIYAPQYTWEFLFLRCLVIPIAFLASFSINRAKNLTSAQNISLAYVFSLAAIINVMMFMMGEAKSPYYTGLILIAIGGLGFFPWTKKYFIAVVFVIFAPYFAFLSSLDLTESDIVYLVVIAFFINGTITILWVIQFFRERLRINEITARLELKTEIEKRRAAENDLVDARDQALQASQAKSTFLASMSHELRTPLNAIIGYSELLQELSLDDGNNLYIKDLKKIDAAGKTLLDLINDVLDISKIEAGQMDVSIEKFDLEKVITNVNTILCPFVEKNNNEFSVNYSDDIGSMESDETKIRQVLYNLLSNAGKFTQNGKVEVNVSTQVINQQEWIRIDVTDDGIGMTPAQSSKVFNAFTQADSTTTKQFGGTGLGLSISYEFSKMLGGDILLKSQYGIGSTFIIMLPRYFDKLDVKLNRNELEKIVFQNEN
ncbi:MAG: ATP-binding protein [Gammaproteobacteria bacterium]|nr:ATP-binding protein [Gammaproteobacteria bacterium]